MGKILILGDSILKGVTFDSDMKRHKLCKPNYSRLDAEGYEVNNLSKMGATIDYGARVLREELTDYDTENVVILEYGGNDCDFHWKDISENPEAEHHCNTEMRDFIKKFATCVEYARSKGARVILANLVPLDSEKYMNWISRGLDYDTILRWLGDKNLLYRWQESYNRTVEKLAEKLGTELVDLRGAFLCSHNFRSLISEDGIHPTQQGHELICETLAEAVLCPVCVH